MVMASDRLASVQEPLVSVDFDVESNSEHKVVSVELSREELQQMITSLEAANKVRHCLVGNRYTCFTVLTKSLFKGHFKGHWLLCLTFRICNTVSC